MAYVNLGVKAELRHGAHYQFMYVASAAEIYAKRQKLGEEAINYATAIKVKSLAQLGRLLKETQRATGGQPYQHSTGAKTVPVEPTLADLGLDKKTSKLAQDIADLSEEQLELVKTGVSTLAKAQKKRREEQRQLERAELAKAGASITPSERWEVEVADIRAYETDRTFDFIITDPPYSKEYLPLYEASLEHKVLVFDEVDIGAPFPWKPKGMHWKTYERLRHKAEQGELLSDRMLGEWMLAHFGVS